MRRLGNHDISNAFQLGAGRLETPKMTGFRPGMSSCAVIGRKLGSVYDVPAAPEREIESALQTLNTRLGARR